MTTSTSSSQDRLNDALAVGLQAFWIAVGEKYPEIKVDEVPRGTTRFGGVARAEINEWLRDRAPAAAPAYLLTARLALTLFDAISMYGAHEPRKCMRYIETRLRRRETRAALAFLSWCEVNGRVFDRQSLDSCFEEFCKEAANPASKWHPNRGGLES